MTIYIDQMFFENFIMNYIILYITSKFSGVESKWYRFIGGAAVGAIYVISSYIVGFYNKPLIWSKIILSVVIVLVSFKMKNIKDFFKAILFFYSVTFFIGGVSFGLAYFLNVSMILDGGILYVDEFPIIMVALGTMLTIIIGKWIMILIKNKVKFEEILYEIEVTLYDKSIKLIALFDSGNNAKEPITGSPVLIIEKSALYKLVPKEILDKIEDDDFNIEDKWKKRVKLIPLSTVNSENKIMKGIKVDSLIVSIKEDEKYVNNIIVVGCNKKLSKEGKYQALIGNVF